MSQADLDAAVRELIATSGALATSLREIGNEHWAAWIEKSNRLLQNRDLHGVEYLLRAYGGMGSLNDVAEPSIDALRSKAWELAKHIQRISN
jgi:hypothetical protein